MPVYNTTVPFLREAVQSILDQSYQDFEFLIVDDGSTGETRQYLEQLHDPRIRLIRNEKNLGVTKALNIGLRAAQGQYIARMDADDVSYPERLETQLAFMRSNPDVVVCGTRVVTDSSKTTLLDTCLESREQYRVRLLFSNPGPAHPTAFIDGEVLRTHGIEYDESLVYAQDYRLWSTLISYGRICILPQVLLFRRRADDCITVKHGAKQIRCDKITQKRLLSQLLGEVTDEEVDFHYFHSSGRFPEATMTPGTARWYRRLLAANRKRGIYDQRILKTYIRATERALLVHTIGIKLPILKKAGALLAGRTH